MPLERDDFVFRKVNWHLPLRRGGWVGFKLTAKLPLSVTKTNCRRPLMEMLPFMKQWELSYHWLLLKSQKTKLYKDLHLPSWVLGHQDKCLWNYFQILRCCKYIDDPINLKIFENILTILMSRFLLLFC